MSTALAEAPSIEVEHVDRMTAEEFLSRSEFDNFELVNGELKERVMANDSGVVAMRLGYRLSAVVEPNELGVLLNSETCYRCFEGVTEDPDRIRKPDLSFISTGRFTLDDLRENAFRVAPDLAVEIVSSRDNARELDAKLLEYLRAGVKLVWIIDPIIESVAVYRSDRSGTILLADEELSGESVIPGFKCKVAELFASLHGKK